MDSENARLVTSQYPLIQQNSVVSADLAQCQINSEQVWRTELTNSDHENMESDVSGRDDNK